MKETEWLTTRAEIIRATGRTGPTVDAMMGDPRFPAKTARGWPKTKVCRLALVREKTDREAKTRKRPSTILTPLREIKLQREITLLDQRIALFDAKYLSAESWQALADEHLTICCAMLSEFCQWVEAEFRTPEAVKKARAIENKGRRLLRDAVERKYLEAKTAAAS